jgi:hypothetical protein
MVVELFVADAYFRKEYKSTEAILRYEFSYRLHNPQTLSTKFFIYPKGLCIPYQTAKPNRPSVI